MEDCGGQIERLRAWNALAGEEVPVVGLVVDGPTEPADLVRALEGSGIRFPLRGVDGERLAPVLEGLGHRRTPLVVLVDGERRVRTVLPLDATFSPEDVRGLAEEARRLRGAEGEA